MPRPSRRWRGPLAATALSVVAGVVLAGCGSAGAATGSDPSASSGGAVALGSSVSAGASAVGSTGALDPSHPVKITVSDGGSQNLLAVAKAEGFFASYGLDPTFDEIGDGNATLAAIQGGSVNIGYADFFAGVNAIAHGFDVDMIDNNNTNLPVYPILVKAGGPITNVKDLAGKRIGVSSVPQQTVNTFGFLKANGVDPSSVKIVVVSTPTAAPQALQRGDFDAWSAGHWNSVYGNDGQNGYDFSIIGNVDTSAWSEPDATTAGWWSSASYATGHPAVVAAFTNAVRAFRVWWSKQPATELATLIDKYYQVDYTKLAGGDEQKLANLVYYPNAQTGPIDLAATQSWYQLGVQVDGKIIASGVDWQSHVFASAKQPAPVATGSGSTDTASSASAND